MTRRSRALRYGACVFLVLAGVACGAAIPGGTGGTICTGLVGVGLVGLMSLVFYEVGLSEDRERAASPAAPERPGSSRRPSRRSRGPERVRDHPRRLR
ncbi:MAG: hypothetical protein WBQ18_15700 [Solirubrobacteraceae bacterium]|jgi:hypothetical protein